MMIGQLENLSLSTGSLASGIARFFKGRGRWALIQTWPPPNDLQITAFLSAILMTSDHQNDFTNKTGF